MVRYELAMVSPDVPDHPSLPPGHISFHGALGYVQTAWLRALVETCGEVLPPPELGVVSVTADYRRELFDGPATFDVSLERIGTNSLIFAVDVDQRGEPAAHARLTLVRLNEQRSRSVPFTDAQRAALQALMVD